ncbi:DegV family protein [Anaerofilum sp. BX8]|uniref:DegV family protein n=1 Tax=Anaerofilum hominis TaxID=2763016 RepID=A0A923L140_9FIRM|nr:DegV family protein [Anaerofilum hominis]MBC5580613.1 DegV family protein [Anaerofilum hominis]
MPIQILADSCCDLTPALKSLLGLRHIPLELRPGPGQCFVDDETLDTHLLLQAMKATKEATGTACPSPEAYAQAMRGCDECVVITLSAKLSGSYNAAVMGRDLVLEEEPEKKIFILDSESAAAGETRLALLLFDLVRAGLPFEEVTAQACAFRDKMRTLFVLEDLSNLIKNGRISKAAGVIGSMLSLRPIMSDNGHGEIACLEKVRGTANALTKLVARVGEMTRDAAAHSVQLVMSQCNCTERALGLKKALLEACPALEDVLIVPAAGVSTVYANDGGIVIAF